MWFPFRPAGPGRALLYGLFLLCGLPSAARALDIPDLAAAERQALERDAGLEDLRARRQSLLESAVAEAQLPDPELVLGAGDVPVRSWSLEREDMTQLMVGVRQRFPAGKTLPLSRDRLEAMAEANMASQAERRRALVRALRDAWIETAWYAGALTLVAAEQAWYDDLQETVTAAYASGRRRQDEIIRIDLEKDALVEEQVRLREARAPWVAELGRWLGESAVTVDPRILPDLAPLPPPASDAARLETHPVLAAWAAEAGAQAVAVDLARQRYKPGWMIDIGYGLRGEDATGRDRTDTLTAMVSFDLPLFTANRQDRRVSAARAEERAVRRRQEDDRRELAARLESARIRHARLGERVSLYASQIIPSARAYVDATLLAYQNDLALFDELVRAEKTLLAARLKHLRLLADQRLAHAELAYLIGDTP